MPSSLQIYPTRAQVRAENAFRMAELGGVSLVLHAADRWVDGVAPSAANRARLECRYEMEVELKVGCVVMLLLNMDLPAGLVNGSRGIVTGWAYPRSQGQAGAGGEDPSEQARLAGGSPAADGGGGGVRAGWPVVTVSFELPDRETGRTKLVERAIRQTSTAITLSGGRHAGIRRQLPLIVAYACTVHKVQGQSFHRATMELENCWDAGQVYVALSRLRTLSGLRLKGFSRSKVHASNRARDFYVEQLPDGATARLIDELSDAMETQQAGRVEDRGRRRAAAAAREEEEFLMEGSDDSLDSGEEVAWSGDGLGRRDSWCQPPPKCEEEAQLGDDEELAEQPLLLRSRNSHESDGIEGVEELRARERVGHGVEEVEGEVEAEEDVEDGGDDDEHDDEHHEVYEAHEADEGAVAAAASVEDESDESEELSPQEQDGRRLTHGSQSIKSEERPAIERDHGPSPPKVARTGADPRADPSEARGAGGAQCCRSAFGDTTNRVHASYALPRKSTGKIASAAAVFIDMSQESSSDDHEPERSSSSSSSSDDDEGDRSVLAAAVGSTADFAIELESD